MSRLNPCPVCGASENKVYARVSGYRAAMDRHFDYLRCESCHSVFLSSATPVPSNIYHAKYFNGGNASGVFRWLEQWWCELGLFLRLGRAPKFPEGAKILDVGFGAGNWMQFLAQKGFDVHGLDPSEEAHAAAHGRGIRNLHLGTLQKHDLPPASFDVVTAIHCLEHDANPGSFIQNAVELLKPGGWLGIAIPNISSWEARCAREKWFHLDPPYHLCLPAPEALGNMMSKRGLMGIRSICPILDYCQTVLYSVLQRSDAPRFAAFLMLPLAMFGNLLLARKKQTGVVEIWGRKATLV